jgi:hypothetical protein
MARVTLTHDRGSEAVLTALTEGLYTLRVTIPGASGDGGAGDGGAGEETCLVTVNVRADGPTALCPAEVTTAPLRAVMLTGGAQGDRRVDSFRWTLEGAPGTSGRPQATPSDAAVTRFTPDVAGDFRLRLRVTDAAGASDECVTVVHATPREGLRVELAWDPPGRSCPMSEGAACDSSDVDLHLLRESGRSEPFGGIDDCHWLNCNASAGRLLSWGASGADDDPRLDLDDVTGHGPENININRPSARSYRVAVHYFDPHGAGPQAATVLVYCGASAPVARFGPTVLQARGGRDLNDLWIVADVVPARDGTGCAVTPITRGGAPWIVPYSEGQRSAGPPAP